MKDIINRTFLFLLLFTTIQYIKAEIDCRQKYNFNTSWKFVRANIPAASSNDFDDSFWETVSCPHTFNDIDTFDDFSEGGHN